MSETFKLKRQVEFNHCDPAGIVFYPRYFEMISSVTERFFSDALDLSWARIVLTQDHGTPMGNIEVRFHAPSKLEDWLDFSLTIKRVGRSSATLCIDCHCDGEPRFTCVATLVYSNIKTSKSDAWPDAARAAMTRFQSPPKTNKKVLP
ncbi:thioesterase family protein [Celeribacter halophilus]|uniref:acyl-CoA thioesterase n=1 Tax=Celeribacter halophilus TaxID=576117 RepID=UPI0026E13FE6|nr:thioesterase family protein [Celeribacter halophilus]MDO6724894.1 thioesterase family protein [Celeribacter halophilus]